MANKKTQKSVVVGQVENGWWVSLNFRHGWFCDGLLPDVPSWIPDIRLAARLGRKRSGRFAALDGEKQIFVGRAG